MLTDTQHAMLLAAIDPERVATDQRNGTSHVEAWDVRRQLIRIFGFAGFSIDVEEMTLIAEKPRGEAGLFAAVIYRAQVMLTLHQPDGSGGVLSAYTGTAVGAAGHEEDCLRLHDAHDQAMKTAESQALKRAAMNLGDQFGLSLYDHGSTNQIVKTTYREVADHEQNPPPGVRRIRPA